VADAPPVAAPDDLTRRVGEARRTFADWRKISVAERVGILGRFRNLLVERQETVARAISRATGKTAMEAVLN
jgi:acyl-CoA reductase-like NAD-dependent aldehyde dehydrogenase